MNIFHNIVVIVFLCIITPASVLAHDDDDQLPFLAFPYFTDFEKPQHKRHVKDNDDRKEADDNDYQHRNPKRDWRTKGFWKITKDKNGRTSFSGRRHLDNNPKQNVHKSGKYRKSHQYAAELKRNIGIPADSNFPVLAFWHHLNLNEGQSVLVQVRYKSEDKRKKDREWATYFEYTSEDNTANYTRQTYSLDAYKGDVIRIRFVQKNGGDTISTWLIDDVLIGEAQDLDGDGIPDYQDDDRDGDGISNEYETQLGFNPDDASNTPADLDTDGIPNSLDDDRDGDSVANNLDVFPDDSTESADNDGDGIGNNADLDDDNDGINDEYEIQLGTDPNDAASKPSDIDADGIPDELDEDRDGDGVADPDDAFPDDVSEWSDIDSDGIGDNTDADRDGDSISNTDEEQLGFDPNDATSTPEDMDGDAIPDAIDDDRDGDGHLNLEDVFPDDINEWVDLDGDGIGDNADPDRDGDGINNDFEVEVGTDPSDATSTPPDMDIDGIPDSLDGDIDGDDVPNEADAFPEDPEEWSDLDSDGIGDNADTDRDGDGINNGYETQLEFDPNSATSTPSDIDTDGIPDVLDEDIDGDGHLNTEDLFPHDATEWADLDNDGIGNNSDVDRDGDGINNSYETELNYDPSDATSTPTDMDGDGIPDLLDDDLDGDGVQNTSDAFPNDANESLDLDGDGIGDNSDTDKDGDGISNEFEDQLGFNPNDASNTPADLDTDGIPDTLDEDIDGDGVLNAADVFPTDSTEWSDLDSDGTGDNTDTDRDGDGISNDNETQLGFNPNDATSVPADLDADSIPDQLDDDIDGDNVLNVSDSFPNDGTEWGDLDGDGTGDNSDLDIDGDGYNNDIDVFAFDSTEWIDLDADGLGDNSDPDLDGDGVLNESDAFPSDPTQATDTDNDGIGDGIDQCINTLNGDSVDSNGCSDAQLDTDADGISNSVDQCPNSLIDEIVDEFGCVILDEDTDGVIDVDDNCPATATGESVDAAGCSQTQLDADNDGVNDAIDSCPATPISENIDINGCSISQIDTDADGINDLLDQCPLTGVGEAVNSQGCSAAQTDTDSDGIFDNVDQCPLTPTNESPDGLGCSFSQVDTDGDGVPNVIDICVATPTGEIVDTEGCSASQKDSDSDGVSDAVDQCATTPNGKEVDAQGCADSERDSDGDGVVDLSDPYPLDPNLSTLPSIKITNPQTLTTVGSTPILVEGTIDSSFTSLIINGQPVTAVNGLFSANVALEEGHNTITARTTQETGIESTATVSVSFDKTPPYVTIDSHTDGQIIHNDVIAVSGLVNDIVRGTIEEEQANVSVNGIPAVIANRSYMVDSVALIEGENTLTITASDQVGNTSEKTLTIVYDPPAGKKLEVIDGQNQSAIINNILTNHLSVRVVEADGSVVEGEKVVFRVAQGSGYLDADLETASRAIVVTSDVNGEASTSFQLGQRVGTGNQKVQVSVAGIKNTIIFYASATGQPADKLSVNSGNYQRTGIYQPLPAPFVVVATDSGSNVVEGTQVEFTVRQGGGHFENGNGSIVKTTDVDGRASANFTAGGLKGLEQQVVIARILDNDSGSEKLAGFTISAFETADASLTKITGVVLDNQDTPIPGVTIRADGTTRQGISDSKGRFIISNAPVGPVHLIADGSTATVEGEYPSLSYNIVTVSGAENPLATPIYLVKLNTETAKWAGEEDVVITVPNVPGFKLEVAAGSVTFPDGAKQGLISATSVNTNRLPMVPPNGMFPRFIVTIQPTGAKFDPPARLTLPNIDAIPPGAQVEMFSFDHDLEEFVAIGLGSISDDGSEMQSNIGVGVIKAGWHCGAQPAGTATAGTNPGEEGPPEPEVGPPEPETDPPEPDFLIGGILGGETSGATYSDQGDSVSADSDLTTNAGDETSQTPTDADTMADPIIAATGELTFTEVDLVIPGRGFDFRMTRTYRSQHNVNGILGHNWEFTYSERLRLPEIGSSFTDIIRVSNSGRLDKYLSNPDGTYTSPDGFYDELFKNPDNSYTIRNRHGFKTNFDVNGKLASRVDRNGNTMSFNYNSLDQLETVVDTLGRSIQFFYRETSKRLDHIEDFSGRKVLYRYDDNGDLIAVYSPAVTATSIDNDYPFGKVKRYTYSSGFDASVEPKMAFMNHNLLTAIDAKGQTYLVNTYNEDVNSYEFDRITTQQFGDVGEEFHFEYTELNIGDNSGSPNVARNQTIEIDRNGNRRTLVHNIYGNLLEKHVETNRNINADDQDEYVTYHTYNTDGQRLSTIFPEVNGVVYRFDDDNPDRLQQGNLLEIETFAGPLGGDQGSHLVTMSYEPIYNKIKSQTDARGNDESYTPQNGGVNSPDRYTIHYTFDYEMGDNLIFLASEMRRTEEEIQALLDAADITIGGGAPSAYAGNTIKEQKPSVTRPNSSSQTIQMDYTYNSFGQIVSKTDPEGNVTSFEYYPENDPDNDGELTVSSRSLNTISGGYRKSVTKDSGLSPRRSTGVETVQAKKIYQYDTVGNVIAETDGLGRTTNFEVNQLNQVVMKTDPAPLSYITKYFRDANNNVVRIEKQNADANGPDQPAYLATGFWFDTLNKSIEKSEQVSNSVFLNTKFTYDANRNLTRIELPEGNAITRTYDERNLVHQLTKGAGSTESSTKQLTYNGNKKLISESKGLDSAGAGHPGKTIMRYDGFNRLTTRTDVVGNNINYSYDPIGNRIREQHYGPLGGEAPLDNLATNNVLLADIEMAFDEASRKIERNDHLFVEAGSETIVVDGPASPNDGKVTTRYFYDRSSRLVKTVDDNNNATLTDYDGLNRAIRQTDALNNAVEYEYDVQNNLLNVTTIDRRTDQSEPVESYSTVMTYDALDRRITITDNLQNLTTFGYDSRNNIISKTDPLGNVNEVIYDGLNRVVEERQTLRAGGTGEGAVDTRNPYNEDGIIQKTLQWNGNSKLVSVTDDNGNITSYAYDALDRRILETYADGTTKRYEYDLDNNVTKFYDHMNSSITLSYDGINRVTTKTINRSSDVGGTTEQAFEYDGLSRRTKATDNNDPSIDTDDSTLAFSYDSLSRMLSETQNGFVVSNQYDGVGNRTDLSSDLTGTITYAFDAINRIKQIDDTKNANYIAEYDYIGRNRVLERRYGNGTQLTYKNDAGDIVGYDGVKRVLQQRHEKFDNALLSEFTYAYDKAGNRRFETDSIANSADVYEYDSAYRLTRTSYHVSTAQSDNITNNSSPQSNITLTQGEKNVSYLIDGVGNWTNKQINSTAQSSATSYTVNNMNEYEAVASYQKITHTANGNMSANGNSSYQYDALNRQLNVTKNSSNLVASYKYDALGRRISKEIDGVVTTYYYDRNRVISESKAWKLANGNLTSSHQEYVYGNRIDEVIQLSRGGAQYYYHENSIGSISALSDSGGNVVERYHYNAYGETTILSEDGTAEFNESTVGNPYMFTGRRFDGETGNYYYRARMYDPRIGRFMQRDPLGYKDGMGMYTYVQNNPTNWIDPYGLETQKQQNGPCDGYCHQTPDELSKFDSHSGVEKDLNPVNQLNDYLTTPSEEYGFSNSEWSQTECMGMCHGFDPSQGRNLTPLEAITADIIIDTSGAGLSVLAIKQLNKIINQADNFKYHYTRDPESYFENGLRADTSVTDKLYDTPFVAGEELGIPTPTSVIPIIDNGQFRPNSPPVVEGGKYLGGGTDFINKDRVPASDLLPARPIGGNP